MIPRNYYNQPPDKLSRNATATVSCSTYYIHLENETRDVYYSTPCIMLDEKVELKHKRKDNRETGSSRARGNPNLKAEACEYINI